ncbi:hypothetical protein [Acinetobacter sp. HZNU-JH01]|uniref:hypothetical protein n=1 Tax=Acinetobacter sp. HZNU-JH01 TaxID=3136280 RepID=UPI0030F48E98
MKEEKLKFDIISEEVGVSELLQDYWQFGEKKKFALTAKEVFTKHNIQSPTMLTKEVGKIGFLQVSRLKDCGKCYDIRNFHVRTDFNYYIDRISSFDKICTECANKKYIKYALDTLEYYKNNFSLSEPNLTQKKELNYLEKIHLYLLIENNIKYFRPGGRWYFSNVLSGYSCHASLEALIEKGFIFNRDSNMDFINRKNNLGTIYRSNKNIFDSSLSEEIFNFLQVNFEYHTEILIPTRFENINDWFIELFSDIQSHKLKLEDIKNIEKFLFNMRVSEIYKLAEFVCNENKIPLLKNNALEFEFLRIVDKYNLEQIYNIFNYQATYTTSTLYKISVSEHDSLKFNKNKLFTKNIGYFISRMEHKSPDQHYSKPLPLSWEQSEFEQFVSAHIIGNAEKWEKLTPKQILSSWLNAVEYDVDD